MRITEDEHAAHAAGMTPVLAALDAARRAAREALAGEGREDGA